MTKRLGLLAAAAALVLTSAAVPSLASAKEHAHHHRAVHGAYGFAPGFYGSAPGSYYGANPPYPGYEGNWRDNPNIYEGEGGNVDSNLNPDFQLGGRF